MNVADIDLAGDVIAGLVLTQLKAWENTPAYGRPVIRNGQKWIARTYEQWWNVTRLSEKQIRRAMAILIAKGLVEKKIFQDGKVWTGHYRLVGNNPPKGQVVPSQTSDPIKTKAKEKSKSVKAPASKLAAAQNPELPKEKDSGEEPIGFVQKLAAQIVADMDQLALESLEEKHVKAKEVLHSYLKPMGQRPPVVWKRAVGKFNGGKFVGDLTQKQLGQLSQIRAKNYERWAQLIELAVEKWPQFCNLAMGAKGLYTSPDQPQIGFLLAHYDVAMQMLEASKGWQSIAKPELEPAPTVPPVQPTVVHVKDSVQDTPATPEQFQALWDSLKK